MFPRNVMFVPLVMLQFLLSRNFLGKNTQRTFNKTIWNSLEGVDENLKSIVFSSKKLTHIGFNKYNLEEMLVELIETCCQKGFLPVSLSDLSKYEDKVPANDYSIEHNT
ncbi:unnamed protein product [Eruca vesicaria subsp. sativa]|uniref:Uncharacterized protein n=1 Tax=Eruca vesicaria subsp. sativa TaxID=29727 RepID=A0ABC8M5Z4_ERUVS|nr:unnamed protein product [Eruca vesicaria subsp. sativa]